MIENKEKKSKKIIIKPQKKKDKVDKLLKVDRNLLYKEGEAIEHVVAYEQVILDNRESMRDLQLKRNAEALKKLEED